MHALSCAAPLCTQDLGVALRRCITLDLQPLSATALTSPPLTAGSPRSGAGVGAGAGDERSDINTLAALLARQGAALVESLEAALVRWHCGF
mgnify:CR=1 FL=1